MMKRYLPILGMAVLIVFISAATSFGSYNPLVNSLGIEPETDEHPWGGDGLYIDNGGNNGGTYTFNPTSFFFMNLANLFDYIIIIGGDVDSKQVDGKLEDTRLPSSVNTTQTGCNTTGKGN